MPRSRTSSGGELLVELRRDDPTPLHRQLERELRSAIRSGRLEADTALPSSRALAGQLGLSRGVIVEAYEQLVAEGYLASRPGGATRVADNVGAARAPAGPARASLPGYVPAEDPPINFAAGRPDVTQFPRQAWMKSLRRVMNEAPSERLTYLDLRGSPELRIALASYLNRVRGTIADPDAIVICNGFAQAQRLVVQVVRERGGRRIAAEDPGYAEAASAAHDHGLEIAQVRVDDEGLDVSMLARTDADAVVVTPAHQFPTGAVLSAERRAALVAWAKDRDALILEDDYDAEYRYDREPIGALHGLAPDNVIYTGSASKTLAPGLRLGWMIVPPRLVEPIAVTKEHLDRGSPSLEQLAFADFLERGEFDLHLRRMRPIYRRRRDVLLRALREHLPEVRPVGASAGLHVLAWLPPGADEAAILRCAREAGVGMYGLASYGSTDVDGPGALDFGYGSVTESEIVEGVRIVADALRRSGAEHAKEEIRPMSYPEARYRGDGGEVTATLRPNDREAEVVFANGTKCRYLATGAQTRGLFGLYRWEMVPKAGGPAPHFHRTLAESFYVLVGTVKIYDGREWLDASPGDFVHVPIGGIHGFRNDADAPATMLIHFAPGAPREGYFEGLAEFGRTGRPGAEEMADFYARHDNVWI